MKNSANKPNILVIFGDDIGWFNLSCYNHGLMGYRTPALDRLAKEGAMFTDAYGQQSCTAGRAAFLTGQNPIRTGLTRVGIPGDELGLSKEDPTLAELLKPHGYATAQFGKNHLGDRDEHLPTMHGFDEFFGNLYHLNAEEEPENPDYPTDPEFLARYGPRGVLHCRATPEGGQTIEDTGPLTKKRMETIDEEILAHAQRFITEKSQAKEPWFVWFNTTRTHIFTHLKEESKGVTGLGTYPDAMVEHDGHIGQLLETLEANGVLDDTLIVYTTDNGAELMAWPDAAMTIFHGEKNTSWEGGYRIPMIIRYPGAIAAGTVVNGTFSLEDLLPTIMAAVGEPDIKQKLAKGLSIGDMHYKVHLDGYNFIPHLEHGRLTEWPRREFFYVTDGGEVAALRLDDWKLMFLEQRAESQQVWLEPFVELRAPYIFNLRSDPLERALHEGMGYRQWYMERFFLFMPAQDVLKQFISTFEEFPPRKLETLQGKFGVQEASEKLTRAFTSNR